MSRSSSALEDTPQKLTESWITKFIKNLGSICLIYIYVQSYYSKMWHWPQKWSCRCKYGSNYLQTTILDLLNSKNGSLKIESVEYLIYTPGCLRKMTSFYPQEIFWFPAAGTLALQKHIEAALLYYPFRTPPSFYKSLEFFFGKGFGLPPNVPPSEIRVNKGGRLTSHYKGKLEISLPNSYPNKEI